MKKIGQVSIVARNGNLLIKTNKSFRIGSKIVNQEIKPVGKIVDIIGPTKTPYIVINTKGSEISAKKGDMLYLLDKPTTAPTRKGKRPPPKKYHKTSRN